MVKERPLAIGELVLRKMEAIRKGACQGKLTPNWEEPHHVYEEVRPGTFHLQTLKGTDVPQALHCDKLRRYYVQNTQGK